MKSIKLLSVLFGFSLIGCVSAPKGPQVLALKSPDRATLTAYRSLSSSKEFAESQLVREKTEAVDFIVESKPVEKPSKEAVEVVLTTVEKNGSIDLHDYGFPELKESIEFNYTPEGRVLKAGNFHEMSLFFVPPLPLPDRPVEEGDTWDLTHTWLSASGVELQLDVIGIHKGYKRCGEASPCVNMEVSGSVKPATDRIIGLDLSSRISGNLLFSIPKGEVYSSEVKSFETIKFPGRTIESKSCMVSIPTETSNLEDVDFPECEF